jgi:hypothetical protein
MIYQKEIKKIYSQNFYLNWFILLDAILISQRNRLNTYIITYLIIFYIIFNKKMFYFIWKFLRALYEWLNNIKYINRRKINLFKSFKHHQKYTYNK